MADIDVCMGGKVAEELIFGSDNQTTGKAGRDVRVSLHCNPNQVFIILELTKDIWFCIIC